MTVTVIFLSFLVMLGIMMLGLPIAVIMAIMGAVGGVLTFGWSLVDSTGPVMWSVMNENLLTAIPLFILLGEVMLRSGMADRMYGALAIWLNRLPGGLLHTNIGCCALFAATSGSSVATAATIGTVATPALNERGYDKAKSLGSIAAGGTLGILIPPSVNMLIYGSMSETSIGQLFIAGIIPGLLLTACFMVYIALSNLSDHQAPEEIVPLVVKLRAMKALIPPTIIFGIVMGSIYAGIATPTESAALGVVAALIMAGLDRHLNVDFFSRCFINTAKTTGMVLMIILAAFILNVTLSLTGVAQTMTAYVTSLGISTTVLLIILIGFYIVLGMFMDVLSMMVLTIPIAVPVVVAAGVDPLWFGIFIILMCELGMITPPVGMNLYVVHGVRGDAGPFSDVVRGAFPYVLIMIAFTGLLIAFPGIVTWLPQTMYGP